MLLVVLYHLRLGIAHLGGAVGVTVFFVLSGYLITGLLITDYRKRGSIRLRMFYARRALRIVPALIALVLLLPVVLVVVHPALLPQWPLNALAASTYSANYVQIAYKYLDLLNHTWTLAVEEHFYLLWPPLLVLLMRLRLRLLISITAFLVLAGVYRTAVVSTGKVNWAYWGSDTNAFALLAGGWLAAAQDHGLRLRVTAQTSAVAVALLVLVSMTPFSPWDRYPVLHLLTPVVGATMLVILGADQLPWLRSRFLGWVGVRSYGLYLWHGALVFVAGVDSQLPVRLVALAGGLGFTVASWELVERPFLALKRRFE